MNIEKVPKAFASFRLLNEVKQALENEAFNKGLSFSKYIEEIIDNRFKNGDISSEGLQLQNRIRELEAEVDSLNEDLENARFEYSPFDPELEYTESEEDENLEVITEAQGHSEVSNAFSTLQMSEAEQEQLMCFLEKLSKVYPNIPSTKLVLGALDTTLRTESAFWIVPTINKFLNQNRLS